MKFSSLQKEDKSMFNSDISDQVRDKFHHVDNCPYQGPRIFFENAGGALTLKSVVDRSSELAAIPDNQGRDNPASKELMRIIDQAKTDVLSFLGTDKGTIFIGESGTEVLFRQLRAAVLSTPEGSHILGSTLEHPASVSACARWAEIAGRKYTQVPHDSATGTVTIEDYQKHVTPDTRVATIIHTSPVTGMGVDVAGITALIRRVSPDCLIIVDGIQHAAHGGLDLGAYDIDGYAISPYKVFSRHGYGIGWISDRLSSLPHDRLIGAADTQWDLGTRDTAAYATFSEVVNYFDWLGSKFTSSKDRRERIVAASLAIADHEMSLVNDTIAGVEGQKGLKDMPKVSLIGGTHNAHREGLVAVVVDGIPAVDVVSALNQAGIRTHARKNDHFSGNILEPLGLDDCVRVSFCHYNTRSEIKRFLEVMQQIAE